MSRKIFLIDVDGVVASLVGYVISELIRMGFKDVPTYDQITNYDFLSTETTAFPPDQLAAIKAMMIEPGFTAKLPLCPGAAEGVRKILEAGHQIIWTTALHKKSPTWCYDRLAWLEKHFNAAVDDVIFAHAKEQVHGDFLIDDRSRNIKRWQKQWKDGKALLMVQPWNMKPKYDRYTRFLWSDIDGILEKL